MSNQYRLQNNSRLFKNQISAALNIKTTIQDKADALRKIFNNMRSVLLNIGKPTMKVRLAPKFGPPRSEDYNLTMQETKNDLDVIFSDILTLEDAIVTSFNYSQTERLLVQNRLRHVEDKLKDAILLSNISEQQCIIGRDSFMDCSKIDNTKIYGTPAYIDTTAGFVTLAQSGVINRAKEASITIVKGTPLPEDSVSVPTNNQGTQSSFFSLAQTVLTQVLQRLSSRISYAHYGLLGENSNGFCGNTHEVTLIGANQFQPQDESSEKYKFIGEENAHADYTTCIDDNPDTWFEYELCNIPEDKKNDPCKQYGFAFAIDGQREIRWDRDPYGGKLMLRLKIILPEPELINCITILPYVPPNEGAKVFDIEDILISADGSTPAVSIFASGIEKTDGLNDINEADVETAERTFIFPKRLAKTIEIQFSQDTRYDTDIGHIYYEETKVVRTTKSYLFGLIKSSSDRTIVERVNGPNVPLSITGAIVESSANTGDIVAAAGAIGYQIATVGSSIFAGTALGAAAAAVAPVALALVGVGLFLSALFGSTETTVLSDTIKGGIESFRGWRYAIGIRDIKVLSVKYAEKSEFVSKPFTTNAPITRVSLRVNDEIPRAFINNQDDPAGTSESLSTNWIKYYISPDDGITWYRIAPQEYPEVYDEDGKLVPEIYAINSQELKETRSSNVGYIETPTPVYSIRLKAVLSRPTTISDAESYSPTIHDYALKMYTEVVEI